MRPRGNWGDRAADTEKPDELAVAPSVCPFCQSTAVSAPAKRADASTYWRCATCGELWNAARLIQPNANRYRRGW